MRRAELRARQTELRDTIVKWLGGKPDDDVLRWLYRTLIIATVAVIAVDYIDLQNAPAERAVGSPSVEQPGGQPATQPLPSKRGSGDRRPFPRMFDSSLRETMTFDLQSDGKLIANGTIMPGTAKAFAAEVAKRGSYVKTIVLRSPGGSVQDALTMGRLIREKKFATEVEKGRVCASSCPLVFAGGVERRAGDNASIGVHQVSSGSGQLSNADGMEGAQQVSAECQKYLRDMGIDLEVWVHAMETPKDELYYFRPDELLALKLATQADGSGAKRAKS